MLKLLLKPVIAMLYTEDMLSVLEAECVRKHDKYIFKSTVQIFHVVSK